MGHRYPQLNGRMLERRLRALGCIPLRQTGSHRHFSNPYQPSLIITFADHSGDIPRGIIEDIIDDLGLTKAQFYDFKSIPTLPAAEK